MIKGRSDADSDRNKIARKKKWPRLPGSAWLRSSLS